MQPPKFTDDTEIEPKSGMKLPGGATTYIIMAVIAIICAVGVQYFMGVSKSILDSRTTTMNETITAMQSDLRASKDSIKLALDGIGTTVDSKVQNSLNSVSNQIQNLTNALETVRVASSGQGAKVDQFSIVLNGIGEDVSKLKKELEAIEPNTEIKKSITDVLAKISIMEASIKKMQEDIIKLTPTTPTTTTTPTTGPTTGFTASVVGTTSMPLVNGTNTINIILNNNTNKSLYAEQISVQLQFLNPQTNINTWGLSLSSTSGNFSSPSYSIVSGVVTYLLNAGEYMSPNTSKTISVVVNSTSAPPSINFVVTLTVNGYSALQ